MYVFQSWIFFVLIFLTGYGRVNTQDDDANYVRTFDDVPLRGYGPDPCMPIPQTMPDFKAPGRRVSEVKCFEYVWRSKYETQELYRNLHCEYNHGSRFVLGGTDAILGESSHVGAVGWLGTSGQWIFKCGATLISEKFALTAAHCSSIARDPSVADPVPKIVRLGARTITNVRKYTIRAVDGKIKRIIVHPEYRPPRHYYDIALMEFEEETPFNTYVHPACLPYNSELPEKATVAGWGTIDLATLSSSPNLQVADIAIIGNRECNNLLRLKRNRKWQGTVSHQICAGNLSGGVDTCYGDSGGPLAQIIPRNYPDIPLLNVLKFTVHRVLGVTSFGYGCARANSPGVYTRVASFIDWIESVVWPQDI